MPSEIIYTKASDYAEFFKKVTGSFNPLESTVTEYENAINLAKVDLKFEFED